MQLTIRTAKRTDGAKIWKLIKAVGTLDLNSEYCYFILSDFFSGTCLIAEGEAGSLLGFVTCFVPPKEKNTLFVWQIGVDQKVQGRGIAGQLLDLLIQHQGKKLEKVKTTISDDNKASQHLFRSFAKRHKAIMVKSEFIRSEDFEGEHEAEYLYTVQLETRKTK